MSRLKPYLPAKLILVLAVGVLTACQKNDVGPVENAGRKIDQSMEKAGEKVDEAVVNMGARLEKAGEDMKKSAQKDR